MNHDIPIIIENLYHYFVTEPNPEFWPERFHDDPITGHGLWSFYQGLQLGMQLTGACLEKI